MLLTIKKLDAARRQIDTAVELIFQGGDAIAVHTLAGAASTIVSDLVAIHCPERSWDRRAQEAVKLTAKDYFAVMRRAQNFLKHADKDPGESLEFDPIESEALLFWTLLNLGELGHALTIRESVFQLWYLACQSPTLDENSTLNSRIRDLFGDLRATERSLQLEAAARVLREWSQDAA